MDALAAVVTARNRFAFKCSQVATAKAWRDSLLAIALAFATLAGAAVAGAAAATATIVGIPLANVLAAIAIVLAAIAVLFFVLWLVAIARELVLEGELNDERNKVGDAITEVTAVCGYECWGDTAPPSC